MSSYRLTAGRYEFTVYRLTAGSMSLYMLTVGNYEFIEAYSREV
jgi:hypothetical protein